MTMTMEAKMIMAATRTMITKKTMVGKKVTKVKKTAAKITMITNPMKKMITRMALKRVLTKASQMKTMTTTKKVVPYKLSSIYLCLSHQPWKILAT